MGVATAPRFADGQLKNVVDIFALVFDVQHFFPKARPATVFAGEFDVCEELHLDRDGSAALAGFASAAGNVEREMR